MKKFFILLILALCTLSPKFSFGNSFVDTTIVRNGKSHVLKICLPETYNPDNAYPLLIGLHYCGGNAQGYRNALQSLSDQLNIIIACPDNNSVEITPSFYDLITLTIDSVKNMYNIDEGEVFLTGMSCNGKATLRYGLEKLYPFKGIFPWVPYISNSEIPSFNYKSDMPISLAVGTNDPNYKAILNLYDSLKIYNENVSLVLVENIGHTLDFQSFPNQMTRCFNYLNDSNLIQLSPVPDIEMFDNEEIEVEIEINKKCEGELEYLVQSSVNSMFPVPQFDTEMSGDVIKLKLKLKPTSGRAGVFYIVVEAKEQNGNAIEQISFKVNVSKTVTVSNNLQSKNELKVYPNPFSDYLNIETAADNTVFVMHDIWGREVYKSTSGNKPAAIDVRHLPTGIYNIKINQGSNSFKRLISKK
jgi:hypothetical protein